jgi:hypothetical protein
VRLTLRRLPATVAVVAVAALVMPAVSSYTPGSGFAGSLLAVAPADEARPAPVCQSVPLAVQEEERKPGSSAWRPSKAPAPVVGYLDRTTARCGDRVGVHLSGKGPVDVTIYRVGWYGGRGARVVWTHPAVPSVPRAGATVDPKTAMTEVRWPTSTRIKIRPSWTPGVYLVVATPVGSTRAPGEGAVMPLVVEPTVPSGTLVVASTLTWASYNTYGGANTYHGARGPAKAASLDRPLLGSGLQHLLVYDLPLARFLGRARIPADWTTDDQLDRYPSLATRIALVFPGHSEYWTARMYDAAEAARNRGTNVAFLGANPVYWQTRLSSSPAGPRRRMLIYRAVKHDPIAEKAPELATVQWRDAPLHRDEAQLVGTTYAVSGVHAGMQVVDAPAWLLAGTGLRKGRGLVSAAANEVDRLADTPGASPLNLQVVLRGAYRSPSSIVYDFASTYYTTPGGGAVFAAGTTAWPCGLDATCPFGPVPPATARALRQMTANLLRSFTTPNFAVRNPSVTSQLPAVPAFWDQLPTSLRGVGGGEEEDGLNED